MDKSLSDWQLPIRIPQMDVCALLKAIGWDKKKRAINIRWVYLAMWKISSQSTC
jgi:3-dehydroquinate synthetase